MLWLLPLLAVSCDLEAFIWSALVDFGSPRVAVARAPGRSLVQNCDLDLCFSCVFPHLFVANGLLFTC